MRRSSTTAVASRVAAGILGLSIAIGAQSVSSHHDPLPLDDELPAKLFVELQGPRQWAAFAQVQADGDEQSLLTCTETVHCYARFTNQPFSQVEFEWRAVKLTPQARLTASASDLETTSFHITDITPATPRSGTFFVAGWSERDGRAIVEEWTLSAVLGQTLGPNQIPELSLDVQPVRRTRIFESSALNPIEAIAWHPVSDMLCLLEYGDDADVHRLDRSSGTLAGVLVDGGAHPQLRASREMTVEKYIGLGYVLEFSDRRNWMTGDPSVLVIPDADGDGSWDVASTTLYERRSDMAAAYPYDLALPYFAF